MEEQPELFASIVSGWIHAHAGSMSKVWSIHKERPVHVKPRLVRVASWLVQMAHAN